MPFQSLAWLNGPSFHLSLNPSNTVRQGAQKDFSLPVPPNSLLPALWSQENAAQEISVEEQSAALKAELAEVRAERDRHRRLHEQELQGLQIGNDRPRFASLLRRTDSPFSVPSMPVATERLLCVFCCMQTQAG